MLICMRTTLNLPDGLMEAAKARAARDGRTVTSLLEEGLRAVLAETARPGPVQLPAYGSGVAAVLVDLDDRAALEDALESE
jgi:plasmid stability protein